MSRGLGRAGWGGLPERCSPVRLVAPGPLGLAAAGRPGGAWTLSLPMLPAPSANSLAPLARRDEADATLLVGSTGGGVGGTEESSVDGAGTLT